MGEPPAKLVEALADRYAIERELGQGGMATVYLAKDLKHDRNVALKVLRQDVAQAVGTARFLQEIRLAARLSHPHILPLFDSGEAAGFLFYVMPNVAGQSVRDHLDEQGPLPVVSLGEWDEAIAAGNVALENSGGMVVPMPYLGLSSKAHGDVHTAQSIYDELIARSGRGYVAPTYLAALAAALGHRESALSHLQDAVRRRDPQLVLLAHGHPELQTLQALQALPEYQAILRDIGVTEWAERGG